MGLYVNLVGDFTCIRCKKRTTDAYIQTKLLRHEAANSCCEYRVGDAEELVGLDDYCPLEPWNAQSQLVVAVGDWDCGHCALNWQWAKAVFEVHRAEGNPVVTLRELVGLRPWQPSDLVGFHFAESWMAELSGLWAPPPQFNWSEGLERWLACLLPERLERVSQGFQQWCSEVAGVCQDADSSS